MDRTEILHETGAAIWYDPQVFEAIERNVFDPDWLAKNNILKGRAQGRNAALFLRLNDTDMVLRHYYRGGFIRKFNKDLFLRRPISESRAMKEFALLRWMRAQDLTVPRPLAAHFAPAGPCYRADLIMERIANAETLADRLYSGALGELQWQTIGVTIRKMHEKGVDHSDLNCRNILVDDAQKIWLIDFDKCERRPSGSWKKENLARLKRSLEKEYTNRPDLNWTSKGWSALLEGYDNIPHQ